MLSSNLRVNLGYADMRLCWSLPLQDLYTALLLECGPPPPRVRSYNSPYAAWVRAVKGASEKYYRRGAPAALFIVRPSMMTLYVEWLTQKKGACSPPSQVNTVNLKSSRCCS